MIARAQEPPMRLGYAVKTLGRPDLKSNDARKHQSGPHLLVSLGYLRETLDYLTKVGIDMYRMSSDIAPYATHPTLTQFHNQVQECAEELADFGRRARLAGVRLSFHPSQFVILNAPDRRIVEQSIRDLVSQADMLDRMGCGPEAVLVVHVGGAYGDTVAGRARWADTYRTLPEPARRRLVLENDDIRYSAADVLAVHEMTGVPLIFDHQHFWCNNPERLPLAETVARFVRTWPSGVRPKIHYSSPRTEMREVQRRDKSTGKPTTALLPPIWTGHADFVNPFEFGLFLRHTEGLVFDVMVEAKSKDLAVLRLKRDLPLYVPDQAARFGLTPAEEVSLSEPEA